MNVAVMPLAAHSRKKVLTNLRTRASDPGARSTCHAYSPIRKPQKIQHLVRKRRSRTNGSLRHSIDPSSVIEKQLLDFYTGANATVVQNNDVLAAHYAGGFSGGEPAEPGKRHP